MGSNAEPGTAAGDENTGSFTRPAPDSYNVMHGCGLLRYAAGGSYDGEFELNQRCGNGVRIFPDGRRLSCTWHNDEPEGRGVETLADGSRRECEWQAGQQVPLQQPAQLAAAAPASAAAA